MYLIPKPQWAPAAVDPVEKILNSGMVVFEWGSGCSTPWIAQRVKYLFTMDDDFNWSRRANYMCRELNLTNVDYSVYKTDDIGYLDAIFWFAEMGGIDLAIVDGMERMDAFNRAVKYVKVGGLIILDDSEREAYAEAFRYKNLKIEWVAGNKQQTTLFRKVS